MVANPVYQELNRRMKILSELMSADEDLTQKFIRRFDYSWLYHENALEGAVLTYHELKSALEVDFSTDTILIPTYEEIKNHKEALDYVREMVNKKNMYISMDIFKKISSIINPRVIDSKGQIKYRREIPLHRLYLHEISPPEKIGYRMRRLLGWISSTPIKKEFDQIQLAVEIHQRLLQIFPFSYGSGKIARLIMNIIIMKEGYIPVIIHANQRQYYYEFLKKSTADLTDLIIYSLNNTIKNAIKFYSIENDTKNKESSDENNTMMEE